MCSESAGPRASGRSEAVKRARLLTLEEAGKRQNPFRGTVLLFKKDELEALVREFPEVKEPIAGVPSLLITPAIDGSHFGILHRRRFGGAEPSAQETSLLVSVAREPSESQCRLSISDGRLRCGDTCGSGTCLTVMWRVGGTVGIQCVCRSLLEDAASLRRADLQGERSPRLG
jgi:hypothetical protein